MTYLIFSTPNDWHLRASLAPAYIMYPDRLNDLSQTSYFASDFFSRKNVLRAPMS